MRPRATHVLGIDIGGTNIRVAVLDENGIILRVEREATPPANRIEALLTELVSPFSREVQAVGVAVAGYVTNTGGLLRAPNLPGWRNLRLAESLSQAISLPVWVENDANAAAWGELSLGGAKGARNAVFITLGTGLGGGVIIDGKLVRGAQGFATEIGHMEFRTDGRACACGLKGCWEQYVSGPALAADAALAMEVAKDNEDILWDSIMQAHPSGREVAIAADRGSRIALDVFRTLGSNLGSGLALLTTILDPEVILLGGGLSVSQKHFLPYALETLAARMSTVEGRVLPQIRPAHLGDDAGLVGAACLARENLSSEGRFNR